MDELSIWMQNREEQFVADIGGLVAIPSVAEGKDSETYRRAMGQMVSYAARDGMETHTHEGFCLSITAGCGEKEIGIWNHLDVVPAEGNWIYPPYSLHRKSGYLIGRGVQDNKGPAVAVYYAMRYCKEKDKLRHIRVRQILGCMEETGMDDVKYYVNRYRAPDYSFVADCGFPVCCGEKGICRMELETKEAMEQFIKLEGGTVCNSVPERAETELAFPGRAAASDGYGNALGISCEDQLSGRLTCNAGVVALREGHVRLVLDIRYPVTVKSSSFLPGLREKAEQAGYVIGKVHDDPPYYRGKDDPFVKVLMDAWTAQTGREGEPFVMGGGTYARHIPNAVAFGPGMERDFDAIGLPEGHGNCHCADEAESLENLKCAVRIYVRAIEKLDEWIGKGE